ncbi:M23 family metallopeptidase [Undibacterium sp. Ji22W]|uniref:M23 family metallopeptidase n=1 Tax=Undibacterium sp. Ji22W TaxID=3413038 RepID=UPI003BF378A5
MKKGQVIARVGNSGDSRWPHLHFQVTTNPSVLESEGLPFVIDQFRMKIANGEWMTRSNEFPWGDEILIDFSEDKAIAK